MLLQEVVPLVFVFMQLFVNVAVQLLQHLISLFLRKVSGSNIILGIFLSDSLMLLPSEVVRFVSWLISLSGLAGKVGLVSAPMSACTVIFEKLYCCSLV